jgi:hypothetical protein
MSRPVSATFLIVCLKAQIIESKTNLNCAAGIFKNAEKNMVYINETPNLQM